MEGIVGSGDDVFACDKSSFPRDDILLVKSGNTREVEVLSDVRSTADSREFMAAAVGLPFTGEALAVAVPDIEIPLFWDKDVFKCGRDEEGPDGGCGVCLGPTGAPVRGFVVG